MHTVVRMSVTSKIVEATSVAGVVFTSSFDLFYNVSCDRLFNRGILIVLTVYANKLGILCNCENAALVVLMF